MNTSPISWRRVLTIAGCFAAVMIGLLVWWSMQLQANARGAGVTTILAKMLGPRLPTSVANAKFADADGDLIADPPADSGQLNTPEHLVFSYIAEGENAVARNEDGQRQKVWDPLLKELAKQTMREVEFVHFTKTDEQLTAFDRGEIHIIGLNTGSVETAVEQFGFVPLCTPGRDDGSYGYTMQIIVPAKSDIHDLPDLRGRMMTFTRPNSNSGFKAALALLIDSQGMLPERDYRWSFSLDHDKSIQLVSASETDAASVASDVLARMVASGQVDAGSLRTIYESESFPPATIGVRCNLAPQLVTTIQKVLLEYDWKGTALESEFGPTGATRFVPVNYKDGWANIRRMERSLDQARAGR